MQAAAAYMARHHPSIPLVNNTDTPQSPGFYTPHVRCPGSSVPVVPPLPFGTPRPLTSAPDVNQAFNTLDTLRYTNALELDPELISALNSRALAYVKHELLEKAEADCTKVGVLGTRWDRGGQRYNAQ